MKLTPDEKRILTLTALGGMLEFYDFIIYGIFSVYFAYQFFPAGNNLISVIESYMVFVLGYIARPIGGIIFSHVGDEYGRKKVLFITIVLMGAASCGIGILPTYAHIGIAAPIILLSLRLIQGLALGGELPSSYVYISESMSKKQGIGFGTIMVGVNAGLLLGMVINHILNLSFTPETLSHYGWRIPFIFGGVLCFVSYKIRKTLKETAVFNKLLDKPEFPLGYLFQNHLLPMFAGIFLTAIMSSLVMISLIFMPTYLHEILKVDNEKISYIMLLVTMINLITIYVSGIITQQTGPYFILRLLLIVSIFLIPLAYWLIAQQQFLMGVIILSLLQAVAAMNVPYLITGLFPTKIRLTGVAMSYNIGFTLFGGAAPIVISYAIKQGWGIYEIPLIYMAIIILICAIGLSISSKILPRHHNNLY